MQEVAGGKKKEKKVLIQFGCTQSSQEKKNGNSEESNFLNILLEVDGE